MTWSPLTQPPDPANWASEVVMIRNPQFGMDERAGDWLPIFERAHGLGLMELVAYDALAGYPPAYVAEVVERQATLPSEERWRP